MRTVFREDHEHFREQARRFIDKEIAPHLADWERAGIVPKDVWRKPAMQACSAPPCRRHMAARTVTSVTPP